MRTSKYNQNRPDSAPNAKESSLYYLQSRYYNPTWGRFLNADSFVSTGQGLLGNNMFAYCGNNPIRNRDSSGHAFTDALGGLRNKFCADTDIECYVGGGIVISSIELVDALVGVATDIDDWIDEQFEEIKKLLTRSLAKATTREYRSEFEEYHIAAKKSRNARKAAAILNEVLPGGVEDPLNKVMLKTSVHRRIHTRVYYSLVNYLVIYAYNQADGDRQQQYNNVVAVLGKLEVFLSSLNVLSVN